MDFGIVFEQILSNVSYQKMCRFRIPLKTRLRSFRITSTMKRLNHLAWRIRRRVSAFLSRLHTSVENRPAATEAADGGEGTDLAGTEVARNFAFPSNVLTPKQPRILPSCHPDSAPLNLPVLERDQPGTKPFAQFATFPTELRLLIWQFASHLERIIEIQYINRSTGFKHSSSPRGPAILQVCHESRTEALKVYRKCFGTKKLPKSLYVNPSSDVLFFRAVERTQAWRCIRGPNSLWRDELVNVRRIAFISKPTECLKFLKKMVCSFPNLEELIILWWDGVDGRSREGRGVNCVEAGRGHEGNAEHSAWEHAMRWKDTVEETWTAEGWWERCGRKPPVVSVRHWCARVEGEW